MKIPIKCAMNIYNKKITKNIVSKNLKNFNSLSFNRPMKKFSTIRNFRFDT